MCVCVCVCVAGKEGRRMTRKTHIKMSLRGCVFHDAVLKADTLLAMLCILGQFESRDS